LDKLDKIHADKEGNEMALLARPSGSIIRISPEKTNEFLQDRKKNAIKPEFLKRCQQYNSIMNSSKNK